MRSAARRRVRKSRGEQEESRQTPQRTKMYAFRMNKGRSGPTLDYFRCKERSLRMTATIPDCKQKPLLRGKKGREVIWPSKRVGPAAGDCGGALGAVAVWGEAVVLDQIAVALDQSFVALRAARVFPFADLAREGCRRRCSGGRTGGRFRRRAGDLRGSCRGRLVVHFVIAVKGGDVPGDIGRDFGEEFGEAAQFVRRSR